MHPGSRIVYIPPTGDHRPALWGAITAISGQSALVAWDHLGGLVGGAPIGRLHLAPPGAAGQPQLCLFPLEEPCRTNS